MAVPKVNLRQRKGKKGISYFIDFAVNGKRYRVDAGTNKKAATEKQHNTLLELSLGHLNITSVANKIISLEELVKIFLTSKRNHIRPSSLKRYQNYLDKFSAYMNKFFPGPSLSINEIRANYIEESFNYFLENQVTNGKNWETKTVNGLRAILIQLLNYGIKQGYLSTNPARETNCFPEKPRKLVEFFNDEELDKIWEILEEHWVEPLKFIVHTGLRKGEWIHLLWCNVNLDENNPSISIVSTREWKTKTGESRVIPLNKIALEIIKKQKGTNPDYVFTSENGSKIHPDKPYRKLKMALKLLGLNGDIHKLRHTFASKLVMNGRPLYDVQKLLGHKDIKTTMIYAHLSPDYLKESVKVLES